MPSAKADGPRNPQPAKKPKGAWRKFADLFTSSDPERDKKRELKAVARSLRKVNSRLYNPKTEQVLPGLGKLFYEFYKTLGPTQTLLAHAKSSKVLQAILIESGLTPEQTALKDRLAEPAVRERLAKGMGQSTVEEIKGEMKTYAAIFDSARSQLVNEQYKSLAILLNLVHFDYYMLLRKFDPSMREGDFTTIPSFEAINAQYIEDELKDFLEILPAFDPLEDWSSLWGLLKSYRGVETVAPDVWRRLLALIRRLKRTSELEMVAQLITGNPWLRPTPRLFRGNIVEEYLAKMRTELETTLQKILKEKRSQSIENLSRQVFGSTVVQRLANYTEEANQQFLKKQTGGYTYVAPLNYLHAFLVDFVQKELCHTFEALAIRGKWSDSAMSQMFSESYHELQPIAGALEQFDAELAPDSEQGRKLSSIAARADKDRQRAYLARRLLNTVNEQARALLLRAAQHFITIGKTLKSVVDDAGRPKPQLILNWEELTSHGSRTLKDTLAAHYKKLYYFVQLLKLYI